LDAGGINVSPFLIRDTSTNHSPRTPSRGGFFVAVTTSAVMGIPEVGVGDFPNAASNNASQHSYAALPTHDFD